RVLRQLLTESVLLACCGGALGALLAYWGKDFLEWLPEGQGLNGLNAHPSLDLRVLGFCFALSLATGILFGVIPGWRTARGAVSSTLRSNRDRGGSHLTVSKSLMIAQVTLCLVLLASAGLFIRTVRNLYASDVGFNPENVIVFELNPRLNK